MKNATQEYQAFERLKAKHSRWSMEFVIYSLQKGTEPEQEIVNRRYDARRMMYRDRAFEKWHDEQFLEFQKFIGHEFAGRQTNDFEFWLYRKFILKEKAA